MKKLFFLLAIVFAMVSCEGPTGPEGPGTNWDIQKFEIKSNHWETRNDGGFIYIYDAKNLTNYIYQYGKLTAYLVQYPNTKDEVLTPLPYTMHHYDENGYWTETYTFDYAPSSIAFYATFNDFPEDVRPGDATFRVVMNWK